MNEQWIRWEPISGLMVNYSLEHIHNGLRGLEILLADPNASDKKVLIVFAYTMISYTVKNFPVSLDTDMHDTQSSDVPCSSHWSFFEIMHSSYIARLIKLSATIVEIYEPRHFVILTADAQIDIVASYEPDVTYITMNLETKTLLYKEMTIPFILRHAPTAHIILYDKKSPKTQEKQSELNLALESCEPIDQNVLSKLKADLTDSEVPVTCTLLDLTTIAPDARDAIRKNGIVWRDSSHNT